MGNVWSLIRKIKKKKSVVAVAQIYKTAFTGYDVLITPFFHFFSVYFLASMWAWLLVFDEPFLVVVGFLTGWDC